MIKLFGWENYRFRVPQWEIEEQIIVWQSRLSGEAQQLEKYREELEQ
jgi:hypothetical protein